MPPSNNTEKGNDTTGRPEKLEHSEKTGLLLHDRTASFNGTADSPVVH
jgi:hypothetical protein